MPAHRTPDAVELRVVAVRPDGDGEAMMGRVRVAIPFTIPGERVRVRVGPIHENEAQARLLEVLEPSPDRVAGRCRHFGGDAHPTCGGCAWQHIAYPRQLQLKQALVHDAAARTLRRPPDTSPTLAPNPSAPWGFRQKAHFAFSADPRGRRVFMGHFARGSRHVLPVVECPVQAPEANEVAFRFAEAAAAAGPTLGLRGLLARVSQSTGKVMVTLVSDGQPSRQLRALTRRTLVAAPDVVSVSASVHSGRGSMILGAQTKVVAGADRLEERIGDITYLVSPGAFFQTSGSAAAILVQQVLRHIPPEASVLDLYCGGGLFALPLAQRGNQVLGIEANETAIQDAVASRQANRIPAARCRFVAAPVEAGLRRVSPASARAVVLDPPRAGTSESALTQILHLRPEIIVYVSCDPMSLARDLRVIERGGFAITKLQPVDMFPYTAEVETVAVAVRPVRDTP